jgi:thiamine phosphate synthase YjbQ (UPF0047 family)
MGWTTFEVDTKRRAQLIDVTDRVAKIVERAGIDDGTCHVFIPYRTAGVTLGTWQAIFLCEWDGPRTRKVEVAVAPS